MDSNRLWTRGYLVATLASFVNACNFYLLTVITSKYSLEHFQTDSGVAGMVTGLFVIGAIISRLFTGRLLGLWGYKPTLLLGLGISLAASLFYIPAPTVAAFIAVRIAHGLGFGVVVGAASTIVADITPPARIGEGMGYFQLGATLATAIGPFVSVTLSELGNYPLIFMICSGLVAIALVLACTLKLERKELSAAEKDALRGFKLSAIIEKPVLPASSVAMMMYLAYAAAVAFLALFVADIGQTGISQWFFLVYGVVVFISRPMVSKLFDKRGAMVILYPALLILTGGFVVLSLVHGLLLLLVAAVLIGLGAGAVQATTLAIVAKITPSQRKGVATSTFYLMSDFGYCLGPILMGYLLPYAGYRGLFILLAGLVLLTLLYCFWQRQLFSATSDDGLQANRR